MIVVSLKTRSHAQIEIVQLHVVDLCTHYCIIDEKRSAEKSIVELTQTLLANEHFTFLRADKLRSRNRFYHQVTPEICCWNQWWVFAKLKANFRFFWQVVTVLFCRHASFDGEFITAMRSFPIDSFDCFAFFRLRFIRWWGGACMYGRWREWSRDGASDNNLWPPIWKVRVNSEWRFRYSDFRFLVLTIPTFVVAHFGLHFWLLLDQQNGLSLRFDRSFLESFQILVHLLSKVISCAILWTRRVILECFALKMDLSRVKLFVFKL